MGEFFKVFKSIGVQCKCSTCHCTCCMNCIIYEFHMLIEISFQKLGINSISENCTYTAPINNMSGKNKTPVTLLFWKSLRGNCENTKNKWFSQTLFWTGVGEQDKRHLEDSLKMYSFCKTSNYVKRMLSQ